MAEQSDRSQADKLLELADFVLERRGRVDKWEFPPGDTDVSHLLRLVDTAIRLRQRPALAFRASVEGWDLPRIVRELW